MTVYATAQEVRDYMKLGATDPPTDAIILTLATAMSAKIDKELGAQSASDTLINLLTCAMTAVQISTPDPHSVAIGNIRVDKYPIAQWNKFIDMVYLTYGLVGELCGPRTVAWEDR